MPLFLNDTCKVCGTARPPDGARFCPACGRPIRWTETAAGRGRAVGIGAAVGVVLILAVLGLSLFAVRVTRSTRGSVVTAVGHLGTPGIRATVQRRPPVAAVPASPPQPADIPASTPADEGDETPTPPSPAVPARPGDTDLTADPLALYAGGPPADRLTVHGLRLALPVSAVPVALLDASTPDYLRDVGGNRFVLDATFHVVEIHLHDTDLLAHWPIDSTNALVGHFGQPADVYVDDDGEPVTFLYPARGMHVRWDAKAGRITEVVLVQPTDPSRGSK